MDIVEDNRYKYVWIAISESAPEKFVSTWMSYKVCFLFYSPHFFTKLKFRELGKSCPKNMSPRNSLSFDETYINKYIYILKRICCS